MNIIKYFKNLFTKEDNAYLINGYASFAIPKRDILNEKQIEILTTAKEEYLVLLKNNIFTSLDLEIDDINNKREMYTKLLLNNMMNETKNNKVLSIKLKNYESDLINLRETLLIRLIALSEIVNQNRFKRRTRDAIINEIGKIQLSLVTIDSQIVSIHNEIEAYLTYSQEDLDLDKRIYNLEKLSEDIVEKCELSSKEAYIAYLERSLEIYCYKNKEEVSNLKDELDSLRYSEINDDNINLLKEKISKLEKMYNIYYEFDRNTITKEDMYSLYETKFYMHAYDYSFRNCDDLEKEVYLDIISKKINTLLNGNSPYILHLIENEDKDKAIKLIQLINILLKEKGQFDLEKVLTNKYKLLLLLSLDYEKGLDDFFENTIIDLNNDSVLNKYDITSQYAMPNVGRNLKGYLFYDTKLSLSSIIKIFSFDIFNGIYIYTFKGLLNYLKNIYDCINSPGDVYVMPEGIVYGTISSSLYDKLKKYKTIIMPKSLKSIEFEVDNSSTPNYCDLVLQEGTESLMFDYPDFSYYSTKFGNVTIPSTLKEIDENISRYVNNLIFEDYKNSEILKCDDLDLMQKNANALFKIKSFFNHYMIVKTLYYHLILKDDENSYDLTSIDLTSETIIKIPENNCLQKRVKDNFYMPFTNFDRETAKLFWDEFHKQFNMGKYDKKQKQKNKAK
ncbi:MAG: hypothetical protein Q4C38_01270 [bacterium]|nr:hypothetical protein [bacterium]